MSALRFVQISKSYRRAGSNRRETVLRDFTCEIRQEELVAIVGPSGIGKSTLLHLAAGLELPDAGRVEAPGGLAGRRVGMVFQQPRLLEWLTVARNVELAAEAAGQDPARARALLGAVGLPEHGDSYPLALSGGQRQRVALARAFAVAPQMLLLDEPFSALDELTARRLRLLLQDLWSSHPPACMLVTHNTQEAAFLADRILILNGPPAQVAHEIEVRIPRPRNPEDPGLFDIHRQVISLLT